MRIGGTALVLILAAGAMPAVAQAPFLSLPLDCTPGVGCYIEDFVDDDPGPAQRDYTCGIRARDGHKGTDIALTDAMAMAAGTDVIAAAPGIVEATRDGVPDLPYTPALAEELKGRECGNAVRIRHENGLQTLYCHMKRGSISVRSGDTVQRGAKLGQVGMSGESNYPHVHIGVLRDGQAIDPFAPGANGSCGTGGDTLWLDPPPYVAAGMFTAGFSTAVPSFEDVQSGAARVSDTAPTTPLVLYAHFYLARKGDVLRLSATGPEGEIFARDVEIANPRKQMFRAFGRKSPAGGWPGGTYRGTARLQRGDKVLAVRFTDITVR